MKVLPFLVNKEKTFLCVKEKLLTSIGTVLTYDKKLNSRGLIDGMNHRLEFKKARTCEDWDDMRPDEQDKEGWNGTN